MVANVPELVSHPHLWRGGKAFSCAAVPSGFVDLDRYLPGGGWPIGALTEIFLEHDGIGELSLLTPVLARMSHLGNERRRWLAWVAPPFIPYAPALAQHGVDLNSMLMVHPPGDQDGLWAIEQALRSDSCAVVLAWLRSAREASLRRLQLLAEKRDCLAILFRPMAGASTSSPAALRLRLARAGGRVRAEIFKCRGRRPGVVTLSVDDPSSRSDQCHKGRSV